MQGAMADPDWIIYCDALILGGYLQKKFLLSTTLKYGKWRTKAAESFKKQNIDELSHVQL